MHGHILVWLDHQSARLFRIDRNAIETVGNEAAIKADGFIVMVHGTSDEAARAKAILSTVNASSFDSHNTVVATKTEAAAA